MTKVLLSIHVLAAIIAIGPVTVAASMFPAAARRALAEPEDQRAAAVLQNLHRICRVYAALGVLVPVFGLATASSLGVLGDTWLIISIVLTVAAAAVLTLLVLPGQATILRGDRPASSTTRSEAAARPSQTATTPADDTPSPTATATAHGTPSRTPTATAHGAPSPTATTPADSTPNPTVTTPADSAPSRTATASADGAQTRAAAVQVGGTGSPDRAILGARMATRLGMITGTFNLLWAIVVVLMIVRPGSTTGV